MAVIVDNVAGFEEVLTYLETTSATPTELLDLLRERLGVDGKPIPRSNSDCSGSKTWVLWLKTKVGGTCRSSWELVGNRRVPRTRSRPKNLAPPEPFCSVSRHVIWGIVSHQASGS